MSGLYAEHIRPSPISSCGAAGLAEPPEAPLRLSELRVLLVEDDKADVYLIQRALAGNPRVVEIVLAQDGVEALELIDSGAVVPHLAIIDLHMPRKDGFSLLRELAARESQFPSVVLTSSKSGADARRTRMRGAELHMIKPNSVAKLSAMLGDIISGI